MEEKLNLKKKCLEAGKDLELRFEERSHLEEDLNEKDGKFDLEIPKNGKKKESEQVPTTI